MLQLNNIVKDYEVSGGAVHALRDVSICFRPSEFVSILGPSGCGKTTLLNVIGGLDHPTGGDLVINGIHTVDFADKDWDSYRNHTVGFVFQSYNLIPHLTVSGNVELALTLSGFPKKQRRRMALDALAKVGLADQADKRPNQLSGGQMQRVAIARALVNNPAIILADEPTGALDSETSVQVMDILKEVSEDRLVIMVTHNPDLAAQYSTRIINLFDGQKVGDTDPFEPDEQKIEEEVKAAEIVNARPKWRGKQRMGHTGMSVWTALSLSMRNLFSKRGRTTMVSIAGSIGIIGIALVLSLSQGLTDFIHRFEENTLSSYPIQLTAQTAEISEIMSTYMGVTTDSDERYPEVDVENDVNTYVGVTSMMFQIIDSLSSGVYTNDLASFKEYLEAHCDLDEKEGGIKGLYQSIQYSYGVNVNIYGLDDSAHGYTKLNPISGLNLDWDFFNLIDKVFDDSGDYNVEGIAAKLPELTKMAQSVQSLQSYGTMITDTLSINMWQEMMDNQEYINSQYDVICGELTDDPYGVVLVVDSYDKIPDVTLFSLNYLDQSDLIKYFLSTMTDENGVPLYTPYRPIVPEKIDFDVLMDLRYKLMIDPDYYSKTYTEGATYVNHSNDHEYMQALLAESDDIHIAAIVRPKRGVTGGILAEGGVYYSAALVQEVIRRVEAHPLVIAQRGDETHNLLNGGAEFDSAHGESYEENLKALGLSNEDKPTSILIYPVGFDQKTRLTAFIDAYNQEKTDNAASLNRVADEYEAAGDLVRAAEYRHEASLQERKIIRYQDMIGNMISTVSIIIDSISYVLIAFISISLLVSSIMIGIITAISVLERTKEIGVLRAIGASKWDVTVIFIAETVLIGLFAGLLGVIFTALLNIPITLIVGSLTGPMVSIVARLPVWGGFALIGVSIFLTLIAGLLPARGAAKKDPVVALRSE